MSINILILLQLRIMLCSLPLQQQKQANNFKMSKRFSRISQRKRKRVQKIYIFLEETITKKNQEIFFFTIFLKGFWPQNLNAFQSIAHLFWFWPLLVGGGLHFALQDRPRFSKCSEKLKYAKERNKITGIFFIYFEKKNSQIS